MGVTRPWQFYDIIAVLDMSRTTPLRPLGGIVGLARLAGFALTSLLISSSQLFAQCPMCAKAAGQSPKAFNISTLVMLASPYVVVLTVVGVIVSAHMRRARHDQALLDQSTKPEESL